MRPVVVSAAVDIDRPPAEVFDYCSDHRHEPEWNPMMRQAEKVTDGPVRVGTRYATRFAKAPPMVMECTRYHRPDTWTVDGKSALMTATGTFRVEPSTHGSHLAMRMELGLRGPLAWAGPLLRRRMQPMIEQDLLNVKAVLEGAQTG